MNAEGHHERQRIGQAKCQRGTPAGTIVQTSNFGNHDETSGRLVVDTKKIKKERNCVDLSGENGRTSVGSFRGDTPVVGPMENGHQKERTGCNNVSRSVSNGFHSGELLQDIIDAKFGQGTGNHGNANKNEKIRLMIEDSLRFVENKIWS